MPKRAQHLALTCRRSQRHLGQLDEGGVGRLGAEHGDIERRRAQSLHGGEVGARVEQRVGTADRLCARAGRSGQVTGGSGHRGYRDETSTGSKAWHPF